MERVIKCALAHDFVEVYAGDVDTHSKDLEALKTKPLREAEARDRLAKEFPEFQEFHDAMLEYELKSTEEARFVYALDKLLPQMNVYLDGNRVNIEKKLTLKEIRENTDAKIAVSPYVKEYWSKFLPLWEELFRKTMNHQ